MNILYIEDDQEIGQWVEKKLREEGYHTHWLTSGYQLPVDLQTYGVVVLDVMLPGLDGFSVGRRIKRQNPNLPVIMLSARTSIEDKLEGLEFADDYMTKPFHPEELLKRIEVQVRKYEKAPEKTISIGHLSVRLDQQVVVDQSSNREIMLTGKQFSIFHFFIRHLNQILTKEQLYEGVWGEPYREGDKSLMVHIRHLREKIERNPSTPEIIETIRGIGYRVRA
ncbi:response regulator transcription factor [Halobacillus locisalis]|uniref:Response regulator transcription factor n=1 Tax=Halobacillus locisalis TaxID=220753 RepID=A0A838CTS2_9BACI|nr:response regulator transcription factor [Halobacillus locisalis]MBA2175209.1 response regulator transcription factor [Halobacillus locisalis]